MDQSTKIAKIAYEINKAYCESHGDFSFIHSWEEVPDWQKSTLLAGVHFHLHHPTAGPEASHESWMKHKLQDGWMYGPVKNPDKKEHPCLVPFTSLPVHQQAKDFLFRQIVHSLSEYYLDDLD